MLHNLLTTVIRDTFLEKVGKHNPGVALIISFNKAINYAKEDGYRYLDLVITAPNNYVQVWVRERWNVLPLNADEYIKGNSGWQLLCNHDSCWTIDGVNKFLWENRDNLITFSTSPGYFYKVGNVPEGCTKKSI